MTNDVELSARQIDRWRADPVFFVRSEFGAEPDPVQAQVLRAFADPTKQRIAMKGSKGPGKTTALSWCAWNFLASRLHPRMAATSISGDNLADNLWPEMAKWQAKSAFCSAAFKWTKTRIFSRQHPETWWLSARQWSQNAD